MAIERALAALLVKRGLHQNEFARAIGVSPTAVSAWLCGHRVPSGNTRRKICSFFGVAESSLFAEPSLAGAAEAPAHYELHLTGDAKSDLIKNGDTVVVSKAAPISKGSLVIARVGDVSEIKHCEILGRIVEVVRRQKV